MVEYIYVKKETK